MVCADKYVYLFPLGFVVFTEASNACCSTAAKFAELANK